MKETGTIQDLRFQYESREDAREQPELSDEWARQLAAMLQAAQAPLPAPTQEQATAPGLLSRTAETSFTLHSVGHSQNSDASGDNRLTLTVTTEELGQVSIIIDRAEGGVRVVLGVGGRVQEHALGTEKAALARALQSVGLQVHSVNVVTQTRVGTVLALPGNATASKNGSAAQQDQAKTNDPNKKRKRIDVIG